jgi:parvulin-like peptidyl-prolyl isomerase
MMRRTVLLTAALLLAGADAPTPNAPAPNAVVAEAGDIKLTASDARNLLSTSPADVQAQIARDPSLLDRLVRSEVVQMLLVQEAHAHQWEEKPDVAFRARQAHDASIASSYLASLAVPPADYPSDADIAAAYEAQKSRLMLPRQYHLAQIFVALPQNATTAAAEADATKRLASIRQMLGKPHADFAAIARRDSDDKATAESGGDLGWLPEDRLRPEVRDAVGGMQENAVSEPLRTPDGWHLIRLIDTKPAAPAALADVRAQLVQALRQQRIAATEQKLIDEMLRRQPIRLDEIGLQHATAP